MLKHFPGSWMGNKAKDIKFFKEYLPFDDIKTVIEPFSGTFAVSRLIYYDKKYKYHINDVDKTLISIYDLLKNDPTKINKFIIDFPDIEKSPDKKTSVIDYINSCDLSEDAKNYFKHSIVCKFVKKPSTQYTYDDYKPFLKRAKITQLDYLEIFKKYQNVSSVFIFLDPPYIDSFNAKYCMGNEDRDNTSIFIDCLNLLKKAKCKVMLIINKNALSSYLYKDYIRGEYSKIYQFTKKKANHLIITNYTNTK